MTGLLAAAPLGLIIGLTLGALGGGGSILTVPALVYLLGETPRTATTASLVIVGLTSLTGALGHARGGRVRWIQGALFGVLGVVGSYVGTKASTGVDPQVLLLAFAGLMLVAAVAMVRRQRPGRPGTPAPGQPSPQAAGHVTDEATLEDVDPATAGAIRASRWGAARVVRLVVAATEVGLLTGFFGVGGGFVVVPALVLTLGYEMPVAVGTSLIVIAVNAATALGTRLGSAAALDWGVVVPFTVAAIIGALGGSRLAGLLRPRTLSTAFASLLVALAIYVGTSATVALT